MVLVLLKYFIRFSTYLKIPRFNSSGILIKGKQISMFSEYSIKNFEEASIFAVSIPLVNI